eukprot:Rmarinus@m.10059
MVFGFLIHTQETERTVLSFFYTPEGNDPLRLYREKLVASQVNEHFCSKQPVSFFVDELSQDSNASTYSMSLLDSPKMKRQEPRQMRPEPEPEGYFRIPQCHGFMESKIIVWHHIGGLFYTLICEESENRLLAVHFLRTWLVSLPRALKSVTICTQPAELRERVDDVALLLHQMLPNGLMLCLTRASASSVIDAA